jgi:hypothetical protein
MRPAHYTSLFLHNMSSGSKTGSSIYAEKQKRLCQQSSPDCEGAGLSGNAYGLKDVTTIAETTKCACAQQHTTDAILMLFTYLNTENYNSNACLVRRTNWGCLRT